MAAQSVAQDEAPAAAPGAVADALWKRHFASGLSPEAARALADYTLRTGRPPSGTLFPRQGEEWLGEMYSVWRQALEERGRLGLTPSRRPGFRSQLAAYHLARGDPAMAVRALWDPQLVPPAGQKEFSDAVLHLGDTRQGSLPERFLKAAEKVITDPVTMGLFALSVALPVTRKAALRRIQAASEYSAGWNYFGLKSVQEALEGTRMGALLRRLRVRMDRMRARTLGPIADAIEEATKKAGRDITSDELAQVFASLSQRYDSTLGRFSTPIIEDLRQFAEACARFGRPLKISAETIVSSPLAQKEVELPAHLVPIRDAIRRQYMKFYKLIDVFRESPYGQRLRMELAERGIPAFGLKDPMSYTPLYTLTSTETMLKAAQDLMAKGRADLARLLAFGPGARQMLAAMRRATVSALAPSMKQRWRMLRVPAIADLRRLEQAGLLNPGITQEVERALRELYPAAAGMALQEGKGVHAYLREYSLNAATTAEQYIDTMIRAINWHVPPKWAWALEKEGAEYAARFRIGEELKKLEAADPGLARFVSDVTIPVLRGRSAPGRTLLRAAWNESRLKLAEWLRRSDVLGSAALSPYRDRLIQMVLSPRLSVDNVSRALSSLIMAGALGLNMRSATQQVMQTLTTTVPELGVTPVVKAIPAAARRIAKFVELRDRGLPLYKAYSKVFGDMEKAGVAPIPQVMGGISALDASIVQGSALARGRLDRVTEAVLKFFNWGEATNRITAFEAGRIVGRQMGLKGARLLRFAGDIVERTQFVPGVLGTPMLFQKVNPLLRQFLSYQARLWGFAGSSISDAFKGMPARLARFYATWLAASEFSDAMGGPEMESMLGPTGMLGINVLRESRTDGVGTVLTELAPPALRLALAPIQALREGSIAPLATAGQLLMPGGVAIMRTLPVLPGFLPEKTPEAVAKAVESAADWSSRVYRRYYADFRGRLPDGRVPLYRRGEGFVAYATPAQLAGLAMGMPWGAVADEAATRRYILRYSGIAAQQRRQIITAYLQNRPDRLARALKTWKETFGYDYRFNPDDAQRVFGAQQVSRLAYVMRGVPAQARPALYSIIGPQILQAVPPRGGAPGHTWMGYPVQ